jgi:hypothetical protein
MDSHKPWLSLAYGFAYAYARSLLAGGKRGNLALYRRRPPNWTEIFWGIHWSDSLLRLVYMWVRISIFYKFSIKEYGEIMQVRPSKG